MNINVSNVPVWVRRPLLAITLPFSILWTIFVIGPLSILIGILEGVADTWDTIGNLITGYRKAWRNAKYQ